MQTYILKRTLSVIPALLGISVLVFLLLRLIPGDVVDQMLGAQNTITEGQRQSLRHFFGLDQPLPVQFWEWIRRVAVGDLGASFRTATPVSQLLLSRLPVTLELTALSMLIGSAIGISAISWLPCGAIPHSTMAHGWSRCSGSPSPSSGRGRCCC